MLLLFMEEQMQASTMYSSSSHTQDAFKLLSLLTFV